MKWNHSGTNGAGGALTLMIMALAFPGRLANRSRPSLKVAATTPQRPEQILVLVSGSPQATPVGGHHRSRDEVVRCQAEQGRQPAHPAAQRQTAHAGVAVG